MDGTADRSEIENSLRHHNSFHVIAQIPGVARNTVKREILLYEADNEKGAKGRLYPLKLQRPSLPVHRIHSPDAKQECSSCSKCNTVCPDFQEEICELLKEQKSFRK